MLFSIGVDQIIHFIFVYYSAYRTKEIYFCKVEDSQFLKF